MVFIIDSPKYGKKEVLIDDEDYGKIKDYKWSLHYSKLTRKFYVRTHSHNCHKIKELQIQRVLTDAPKNKQVDHINGDPLDNRKENLRICTQKENCRNRGKSKNNTSGYKGVSVNSKNTWQAEIYINNKNKYLGSFDSKDKAAIAYNFAALEYYGQFAQLNNIMAYNNAR